MNSIPLIKGNTPQEINTSIISLKKALAALEGNGNDVQNKIKQINELINGINSHLDTIDGQITTAIENITEIASSLPTDAVLHYSFDEVPDYPDGTAIEKYIGDFTSVPTDWSSVNYGVLTVSNGELINTVTNGTDGRIRRYYSSTNSAIIKIKIRATINCKITISYYNATSSRYEVITALENAQAGQDYVLTGDIPRIDYVLIKAVTPTATDFQLILSEYYIGDGSYATPIIDNANGQNNGTNNGGLAVKGVSGKGAYFLGAIYKTIKDEKFTIKPPYTQSIWCKLEADVYNTQYITDGRNSVNQTNTDEGILILPGNRIEVGSNNGGLVETSNNVLQANKWQHIVAVCENISGGNKYTIYVDGVKVKEAEKNVVNEGFVMLTVGDRFAEYGSQNKIAKTLDDYQIFDRALSETEVQALYLNKANTPKYYSWADWKLNQMENANRSVIAETRSIEESGEEER